jgi:hypothetical protein
MEDVVFVTTRTNHFVGVCIRQGITNKKKVGIEFTNLWGLLHLLRDCDG